MSQSPEFAPAASWRYSGRDDSIMQSLLRAVAQLGYHTGPSMVTLKLGWPGKNHGRR